MAKNIYLLTAMLAAVSIAIVACGGAEPAIQAPTSIPVAAPTPAPAQPSPTPAAVAPGGTLADDLLALGPEKLTEQVMNSPELMACIAESVGFATMVEFTERPPTEDEINQMVPCFIQAESVTDSDGKDGPTQAQAPKLTAPEGVPWYDGPLFDSHMHVMGLSNPFYGERFTTSDVLHMMDRNDIRAGVGFFMPPVTARQSEVDELLGYVDGLEGRLVALWLPPPFDFGLDAGFMGFADGTYTRSLLGPLYPPEGTLDGFGEIAFYTDHFSSLGPGGPEMDDVYPMVAQSDGVIMIHPRTGQTADEYASVIRDNPGIKFLFHGTNGRYDKEGEGIPILGLLNDYDFDNVYYSLDTASILGSPQYPGTLQMDPESTEKFVEIMNSLGVQDLARLAFEEYGQIILDHPDKTLWGTDVINSWHFEDAAIDMLVDFSRRFIAMLPPEIQEKFAFSNAWDNFSSYLD